MVQAISGISGTTDTSSAGGSVIAIQTQIDQCNGKLADWIACPSGKTPEGKKIIETLQTRIGELKSRLSAANDGSARSQSLLSNSAVGEASRPSPATNPVSINPTSVNSHGNNINGRTIDLYI